DHLASSHVRRHGVQPLSLPEQHADARWPIHFVSGYAVEIAVKLHHVDFNMGGSLSAVNYRDGAGLVSEADDVCHRIDRTQAVRRMIDSHDAGSTGNQF